MHCKSQCEFENSISASQYRLHKNNELNAVVVIATAAPPFTLVSEIMNAVLAEGYVVVSVSTGVTVERFGKITVVMSDVQTTAHTIVTQTRSRADR